MLSSLPYLLRVRPRFLYLPKTRLFPPPFPVAISRLAPFLAHFIVQAHCPPVTSAELESVISHGVLRTVTCVTTEEIGALYTLPSMLLSRGRTAGASPRAILCVTSSIERGSIAITCPADQNAGDLSTLSPPQFKVGDDPA